MDQEDYADLLQSAIAAFAQAHPKHGPPGRWVSVQTRTHDGIEEHDVLFTEMAPDGLEAFVRS
jgi:hypothetical protein